MPSAAWYSITALHYCNGVDVRRADEEACRMRPVTPRGFRDVLLQEAAEREALVSSLLGAIDAWGYAPVATPVVEEYRTLETGAGGPLEGTAFRLLDVDGSLLALRPEMTVPIARLVAMRLSAEEGPQRLRYAADVYREHESLRGEARQFTQVGVELVGASGPAADAEVIAVLVDALDAAGLAEFTVSVGTVAVLRAVLEASGAPAPWRAEVMEAAHGRNLVALDRLAGLEGLPGQVASAVREVPRLRGGAEAIDACRTHAAACGCAAALDDLAATWRLLDAAGVQDSVRVDFGVMRAFDYYTGLVIEAYAPGLGVPLGGGGRYDGVLARFGTPAPAAGFALGLERVHIALAEQGTGVRVRELDAVLGGQDPAAVLAAARVLREAGWRVRVAPGETGSALARAAGTAEAAEALEVRDGAVVRVDRSGGPALPLGEPVPAPPSSTWAAGGGR
ncbi:MAG: ATP phosphoribosyltransferase regulatory subunit [Coriobacteriaceae bacterium]|nr:ATP phosphoribosyltransferase regulatory subunit [Coriobacteriaceae bacterium]